MAETSTSQRFTFYQSASVIKGVDYAGKLEYRVSLEQASLVLSLLSRLDAGEELRNEEHKAINLHLHAMLFASLDCSSLEAVDLQIDIIETASKLAAQYLIVIPDQKVLRERSGALSFRKRQFQGQEMLGKERQKLCHLLRRYLKKEES